MPSRYDSYARQLLDETQAEAVLLAVRNGNRGDGCASLAAKRVLVLMPAIIRSIAKLLAKNRAPKSGHYDSHLEYVHKQLQAESTLLIVVGGKHGSQIATYGRKPTPSFASELEHVAESYFQDLWT